MQRLLWRDPDAAGREKIAEGLNAALEFGTAVNDERPKAWLRTLQLFYLCDPEIILVTSEEGVLASAENSAQAERIWSYDRLKRESGVAR